MAIFKFKALKPKKNPPYPPKVIRLRTLNWLRKEGTQQRNLLKRTVIKWKGARPVFTTEIHLSRTGGGIAEVTTRPTGTKKAVNKWVWLNEGTKIRWAMMSPNWKSKTTPGTLITNKGRGKVLFVGKRAFKRLGLPPRPGIKPREWTIVIQNRRQKPFLVGIRRIIKGWTEEAK